MDEGELVESGSHDELLDVEGEYAALWEAQADETRSRAVADD
jgi:ATP-binding cassette subfamily B protein